MGELVPSVLLHGQALQLLKELADAYKAGTFRTVADGVQALSDVVTRFEENVARPIMDYDPVVETEPPLSEKMNRFLEMAARDINLLQQQYDILHASSQFVHNLVTTEVLRSKNENARAHNKLKTLQMYSASSDPNTIAFGDTFKSLEFTDESMTLPEERVMLMQEGHVTLAPEGELEDVSGSVSVKIIEPSNGFLGNNHEVESTTTTNDGRVAVTLKSEVRTYGDISAMTDTMPNTIVEYERYDIASEHIDAAGGLGVGNFSYLRTKSDGTTEEVVWVGSPGDDNVLHLALEFEFSQATYINSIEYIPYGLDNNANNPVLVRAVQTSIDGTEWLPIDPPDQWIGTDINLNAARSAPNMVSSSAAWSFKSRPVRYVRIYIEQPKEINTTVGHIYWVSPPDNTLYISGESEQSFVSEQRVKGPVPPEDDPGAFHAVPTSDGLLQRREAFPAKRWAIGVRDIAFRQVSYASRSVLVTKRLHVGGIVDRVMLTDAQVVIPGSYPATELWVKYWVSPDEGENWYQISRIQDDYLDIPEQIAFNDPLPKEFQEPGVRYITTRRPVETLRLKIELARPGGSTNTTPVLKSYTLKVRRR